MRKLLLTAVASCVLVAVMPATALAHGRHHRRHHARIHHKRLGSDPMSPTTSPTTTSNLSVAAFDPTTNVLMISNSSTNGGTVSGTVTPDTRLICISPQTMQAGEFRSHDHSGWGGDNGGGQSGGGDDQGQGDDDANQSCTTANLTAGTQVKFADLSMSSNGNNWDVVVLITQPSTVPTVPDTDNDGD